MLHPLQMADLFLVEFCTQKQILFSCVFYKLALKTPTLSQCNICCVANKTVHYAENMVGCSMCNGCCSITLEKISSKFFQKKNSRVSERNVTLTHTQSWWLCQNSKHFQKSMAHCGISNKSHI